MQKKLIAVAVAALASSAAFAQTNVTVYGVADVTFENAKATGSSSSNAAGVALGGTNVDIAGRQRVSSNSSLVGFRGTEDLGNGLKAVFQFESGVAADGTGAGTLFNSTRDTWVGLDAGFGSLRFGNLTGPARALGAGMDFTPGATGVGFTGSIFSGMGGTNYGKTSVAATATGSLDPTFSDARLPNSIAYVSPNLSGFQGVLVYHANEGKSLSSSTNQAGTNHGLNDDGWSLGLTYANGPLYVGYAYLKVNDKLHNVTGAGTTAANCALVNNTCDTKGVTHRAGVKYTLAGATTFGLYWDRKEVDESRNNAGAITSGDAKRTSWGLGVSHVMGAHNFLVQYAVARDLSGNVGGVGIVGAGETGAKMWSLGYNYSLSKRTMVKVYYSQITNENNAGYDFYVNGVGAFSAGADPKAFGAGLRHTF